MFSGCKHSAPSNQKGREKKMDHQPTFGRYTEIPLNQMSAEVAARKVPPERLRVAMQAWRKDAKQWRS